MQVDLEMEMLKLRLTAWEVFWYAVIFTILVPDPLQTLAILLNLQ